MALITISGSQGQGKTTVLSSLAELGHKVIPHKTSRLILQDWGCTLNEVNKDLNLKKKFQDEILVRHYENNKIALNSEEVFLSERSFADIFTYTIFTLGAFNEYSEWLDEYYLKCKEGQKMYDAVISLNGRTVDIDNDGVRSVNQHFTESVDTVLGFYLNQFEGPDLIKINTPIHSERVDEICNYINSL